MDAKKCDLTGVYWTVIAVEAEREFVLFRRLDDGTFQELDVHPTIMNKVNAAINNGMGRLTNHNTMKKVKAAEPKKKPEKPKDKKSLGGWSAKKHMINKKVSALADELQKTDPELTRREARKLARKHIVGRAPYRRKGEEERAEQQQAKMEAWKKETEPEKDEYVCDICKKNPVLKKGYMCPECEQNFEAVQNEG